MVKWGRLTLQHWQFSSWASISLQLTSIFPVTCYFAVLWPQLQLQWQSGHCLWGYSGLWSNMNKLDCKRELSSPEARKANDTTIWASRGNDTSLETIWFKAQLTSDSHTKASQNGSWSISLVVTIATQHADHIWNKETAYIPLPLDPVTYFSVFKLWLTLRVSANAEAPDSLILFPSRLWKRVCVLQN